MYTVRTTTRHTDAVSDAGAAQQLNNCGSYHSVTPITLHSVLWHGCMRDNKDIRPAKNWCHFSQYVTVAVRVS